MREVCALRGGGLQQAVDQRLGISSIRCLAAREKSDIELEVYLEDPDRGEWFYSLKISQDNNRRPIVKSETAKLNGTIKLSRPDAEDKKDPERLFETAIEQVSANKDFRPISDFFQSINYQHLIPQLVRAPQEFSPRQVKNDPFGRDFLVRISNVSEKIRNARLTKISKALQVAAPQLKSLEIQKDEQGIPHLVGLFDHWRPNAGRQNESQLSDGTLRLLGLLWSLFEGEGLLMLEEPELSLHAEVVRQIPDLIERISKIRKFKRQVFISTHSDELLSNKGIGPEEMLRLEPSKEGTLVLEPSKNTSEVKMFKKGLSAADVLLPKSAPSNAEQLIFAFD